MMNVIGTCCWLSAAMFFIADMTKASAFPIWGMMFFLIVPVLLISRLKGWA